MAETKTGRIKRALARAWWLLDGFRWPCRWWGCSRDWPEMEKCWSCGRHVPLDPVVVGWDRSDGIETTVYGHYDAQGHLHIDEVIQHPVKSDG